MASNYTTYPSGFKVPVATEGTTSTEADAQVCALHQLLEQQNPIVQNWQFISEVLDAAKRLVPSFTELAMINRDNAAITGNAYDLLVETANFINKGYRLVSLPTLLGVVIEEQQRAVDMTPKAKVRPLIKLEVPARHALYQWAQRPGGVNDILCTLNYIFGTNPHE